MNNNKNISSVPKFAVVGHPNKGKSSIVATLANDARVSISPTPGTTTVSHSYPMKVDGNILYELIDTPGFQRAHEVLNWLNDISTKNEWGANERQKAIKAFLESDYCQNHFKDECELLKPIMDGAGILYVVDGSRPYGREYEAEMDILRWTGRPSMALINKIGQQDFAQQWQNALGQYFKIVRQFNPMDIEWEKRLSLLRAFGEIHQPWQSTLQSAVAHLESMRADQAAKCSEVIANAIADMMTHRLKVKIKDDSNTDEMTVELNKDYFKKVRSMESATHKKILEIYHHKELDAKMESISGLNLDLFSEKGWSLFGLNNKELMMTGMAGGAAAGGVLDVAVGGASLLAGAGIGALIGGASVWFSQDKMANVKILGLPFGEKYLRIGPIKNPNFPYVVLSRALMLHKIVSQRTHANRELLQITDNSPAQLISESNRKELEKHFIRLRQNDEVNQESTEGLAKLILDCISI